MTVRGYLRGHPIRWCEQSQEWVYEDTGEPTVPTWEARPCGHCGLHAAIDGNDPCLGTLPGVANACCGHGRHEQSYIQFENGVVVRGFEVDAKEQTE